MPAAIDAEARKQVIKQWVSGDTRTKIATDNGVGEGTVSNIVNDFKKGLDKSEFESVRELAVQSKKEGMILSDLASRSRIYNFINKLGANEDQIESFIINCTGDTLPQEQIVDLTNQLFNISKSESIPLEEVPSYIKQKLDDKQRLDKQIEDADARLQSKNVNIEAVNEHLHLKEELGKFGLSTEDPTKLLNVLASANGLGFDAKKIVAKLSSIRPLEKRERQLRNNCTIFVKQADRYKALLPLAEQIASMRIGTDELLVLKIAVSETSELYNLPISAAAFRVINDIRNYNKLGGLKKQLSTLYMQVNTFNEFCSRQSQALTTLVKLQCYGLTERHIVSLHNLFEKCGHNINLRSLAADLDKYERDRLFRLHSVSAA